MSSTVLSTKILTLAQKELLLNAGLPFVEYDALGIEHLDFEIDGGFEHHIFTSQNAVRSFLKNGPVKKMDQRPAFCVGEKTKRMLQEHDIKVVEMAQNSAALAQLIVSGHRDNSFLFFSGNLRRDDIPDALKKYGVHFKEIQVYHTLLKEKAFDRIFSGVLFFSPSGVESYTKQNNLRESLAFCIGETTAAMARKHTDKIRIANKPTIENVLVQAVKHYKNSC